MWIRAAAGAVLLTSFVYASGGRQGSAVAPLSLDFCDFVPYEYTFHLPGQGGTMRQTVRYRIVELDGTRLLERRLEQELVEPVAIPRATEKRTQVSLAALPDLRPHSTRIVTHEWKDGDKEPVAWSTVKIEARFTGHSVHREVRGSNRKPEVEVRTLPPGVRLSEMMTPIFVHAAGARPPDRVRVSAYDAEADRVSDIEWQVEGQSAENVSALGQVYQGWAVRTSADTVAYYRAERPRIFLGADRIVKGERVRYYRLMRLWLEGEPPSGGCRTSAAGPVFPIELPSARLEGGRP